MFPSLLLAALAPTSHASGQSGPVPGGISAQDWAEIRAAYEAGGAHHPATLDPLGQEAYLKASNSDGDDWFGVSVSVSGDTVVVGAHAESSNATGINGNQSDNSALRAGAAYVFVRNGTSWSQQAYLKASNTDAQDTFGISVSISGDTIVVGAHGESSNATGVNGNQSDNSADEAGAAYVFVRSGSSWSQQAYLKASNTDRQDEFGKSVSVSGDTIVVGAHLEDSNAFGINGNGGNNGSNQSGAAYVFVRNGTSWSQQAYLKASDSERADWFGWSVSISGETTLVAAPQEDSDATGVNGSQFNLNAVDSGAAYVFVRNGSTWSEQAYLKASNTEENDGFGGSVSVSGNTIVVGAAGEDSNATGVNGDQTNNGTSSSGAAYVFVRSGTSWSQQAYLKASNTGFNDSFGGAVAVSGDTIVVGATNEWSNATGVNGNQANNTISSAGAAYLFLRAGTSWSQHSYIKASNPDQDDKFGCALAASGDTVVAGAYGEASGTNWVNGNQANNFQSQAGAAYVFGDPCESDLGFQGPGTATATFCGSGLNTGESSDYVITGAPGGGAGALLLSANGFPSVPILGGTLVSFGGFAVQAPLVATPTGTVSLTFNGIGTPFNVVLQSVFLDLSLPGDVAFSNAVLARFGQ